MYSSCEIITFAKHLNEVTMNYIDTITIQKWTLKQFHDALIIISNIMSYNSYKASILGKIYQLTKTFA